jgi:hypothetical protein
MWSDHHLPLPADWERRAAEALPPEDDDEE